MTNAVALKLTRKEIEDVFKRRDPEKWGKVLDVYIFLRENLQRSDAEDISADYQRKFNYFYQVRRNAAWREKFHSLFSLHSKQGKADFGNVLHTMFELTGMVEASFASKFVATIDANLPIIDQHVLTYIDQKLPSSKRYPQDRIATIIELHDSMRKEFATFLNTARGRYLTTRFAAEHKDKNISPMKMLDFVLWQSGGKKKQR